MSQSRRTDDTARPSESDAREQNRQEAEQSDVDVEGRHRLFMDVDRMINEGLGGGQVGNRSGKIGEAHVDTLDDEEGEK